MHPQRARAGAVSSIFCGVFALSACHRASPEPPSPLARLEPSGPSSPPGVAISTGTSESDVKLRRLDDNEVTPALAQKSATLLDDNAGAPLGTEIRFELEGRQYLARIEKHWDESRGPHNGVTLYAERSNGSQ
jgi:hypothetical protein